MARQQLRAVADDEKAPERPKKLSITEAAAIGDHLELLRAMRERVATAVQDPNCPPRDLAALTRRLQELAREIEAIEARLKEEAAENADVPDDEAWDAEAL